MDKVNLSAPWVTYVHELNALFDQDIDVTVQYDSEENIVKLFVEDPAKADALTQLLPTEKDFGNVKLKIEVVPANKDLSKGNLFEIAFRNNPALNYVEESATPFGDITYIVFQKEVVQFYNDQMDDLRGNKSTLFQEIAKDVFGTEHGVYYCTSPI